MSVPPSGRRQPSTPPSKGKPDEDSEKTNKDFKLPPRKQSVESKEEELTKKKGLFDIAAEGMTMQEKQQNISQQGKTEIAKAGEVTAATSAAQVNQVSQLVQKMVETMHIGQINAQNFASLNLKASAEVPQAFAGANLTLSYQDNGLSIHFDNFMTPQQQNIAITMVEKNKEQLEQMVQALNAKNIQVAELTIGNHTITIPRVAPLPPPFQAPPSTQAETEQQRREGENRGEEEQGGEPR